MGDWPAIDSRQYIVAFEMHSTADWPPDFALPSTLTNFDTGIFLPRGDPDWFRRPSYPPRILLVKDNALYIVSHGSAGEPPRRCPMEHISWVESGHMLLKGWLRFTGSGFDYTVRYNTRGFPPVFRFMRRFRDKLLRGALPRGASEVQLGASLDIKFANALARELDSEELLSGAGFPSTGKDRLQKLVASIPPLDRGRFAGADRQAAAVDYRPRAGIPFAIREHRIVCSTPRRARHRSEIGPARTNPPSRPERKFRVAGSDRVPKPRRVAARRGRFRGGAGDSEEAPGRQAGR